MKKILLSLMFVFTLTSVSNAQALIILLFGDKLSTETFQMGINGSLSASNINGIDNTNYRISWAFGAFGEVRLSDYWFLHFNLTVKTPGGAKNVEPLVPVPPEVDTLLTGLKVTRSFNYITLPIFIKYKLGSVKLGVGAQLGYLTSADDTYDAITPLGNDLTVVTNIRDNLNHWDAGVTGIIDYFFKPEKNMRSLRISLTYYYGLTDMLKDNTGNAWNNSIFLLSVGIPVGGSGDVEEVK